MDRKFLRYGGYKQLRNRSSTKETKLANLRQLPIIVDSENVESVQQKDLLFPKISRLEKLRTYRVEKDLKKKIELKSKLPPFKPSGSAKPRSADNSPAVEQQLTKPSFIPRMGATLKPPSIFVRKRSPKDAQNLKAPLKKISSGSNSTSKKEKASHFESLSPGFPSDISCIEPILKDVSFAPIEFTFSSIENVDQFDFLPVSTAEPLPESVLRRSTPIRNQLDDQSFRLKKTANDISSKIPLTRTKPVSIETMSQSSASRPTSVKSLMCGSIKTKPGLKKQTSLTSTPANCSSMARRSDLSSALPKSGSGKTSTDNRKKMIGSNSRDNSLSVSNKAQLRNKEKNVGGNASHKKESVRTRPVIPLKTLQKKEDKETSNKHIIVTKTLSNNPRHHSCLKNTSKEPALPQKKNENHKVLAKPIVVSRKMNVNNKKATPKQVLVNKKSANQVNSISVKKQSPDQDEIGKKSLEEDQRPCEKVEIPILHQESKSEDKAAMKSTSFDNNQSEDIEKSILLEKNQCEDDNKVVIESTSLNRTESAGDDKMMMKALEERQDEDDDGKIVMKSVALDGNPSEDDGKIVMKSELLAVNQSQESETELLEPNKSNNDNEVKDHLPVDSENETNALITESLLFENLSLLSLEGNNLTDIELNLDVLDGSSNVSKCKDGEDEAVMTSTVLDETTRVESSLQRSKSGDSSTLQKACSICSTLICSCISDEISLQIEAALSSEATSTSSESSTSPENSKNATIICNPHVNISNEECSLANVTPDSDDILRSSEGDFRSFIQRFQWHNDSLDNIKCKTSSKLSGGNDSIEKYKVPATTPLRSITNIVSRRDSVRKARSIVNKSQHLVDENTPIAEKVPSKRLNPLEFSTNFTDISFIEDEVMPDINLEALDDTLDSSAIPETCYSPESRKGIKFYHYQETRTSKDLLAFTPVLQTRRYPHLPTHAEGIQKNNPNTLVSVQLDALNQFEGMVSNVEEGNLFDNQDSMNASYLEEENVPVCSVSLLGTPQVSKPPRGPIPDDLMAFSPLIKF